MKVAAINVDMLRNQSWLVEQGKKILFDAKGEPSPAQIGGMEGQIPDSSEQKAATVCPFGWDELSRPTKREYMTTQIEAKHWRPQETEKGPATVEVGSTQEASGRKKHQTA